MSADAQELKEELELDYVKLNDIKDKMLNGNLKSMPYEYYMYYYNMLTQGRINEPLNLTKNPIYKLDSKALRSILNALNNRKVTSLILDRVFLGHLTLEQIQILGNAILESNLNFLNLYGNDLSVENAHIGYLFKAITDSSVKILNLKNCSIYKFDKIKTEQVFSSFSKSKLVILSVSEIPQDDECVKSMFESIANSNIHTFDMGRSLAVASLVQIQMVFSYIQNSKIKNFSLARLHELNDECLEHIFQSIYNNPDIISLSLDEVDFSKINPSMVERIFDLIAKSSIKTLSLKYCELDKLAPELLEYIFKKVEQSNLTSIDLGCNNIFSLSAPLLRKIYVNLTKSNITNLSLAGNKMPTDENTAEVVFLFDLIKEEKKILSLNLGRTGLRCINIQNHDLIFKSIAESTITSLSLDGNELGFPGITVWKDFVNSSIINLSLEGNHLGTLKKKKLGNVLDLLSKSKIQTIDLRNNYLDQLGSKAKKVFLEKIAVSRFQYIEHDISLLKDPILAETLNKFNLEKAKEFEKQDAWAKVCVAASCLADKPEYAPAIFNLVDVINEFAFGKAPPDANTTKFNLQKFSQTVLFQSLHKPEVGREEDVSNSVATKALFSCLT